MIRLQEVTYLVHDHDEALRFFVDAIGFTVRQDEWFGDWRRVVVGPPDGGTGVILAVGPEGAPVGRQVGDDVPFFLETDDFAAARSRMIAHGVRFREEPRYEAYGTVAIFEDLYGAPWDLIQPPALTPQASPASRPGEAPEVSVEGPQRQLTQQSPPAVWADLLSRMLALPDVVEGHSQVSPASTRALLLTDVPDERTPETNLAPGQRLEPAHLHGLEDTSLHLCLPHARALEVVERGWAVPHQYGDFGTELLVFGPRDDAETGVVVGLVEEALAFARGASPRS